MARQGTTRGKAGTGSERTCEERSEAWFDNAANGLVGQRKDRGKFWRGPERTGAAGTGKGHGRAAQAGDWRGHGSARDNEGQGQDRFGAVRRGKGHG